MIELLCYSKIIKEKKGEKIIKDYSDKAKICGYVEGWNFLNRKKKPYGVIEKMEDDQIITKYEWGLTCLKLNHNGEIFSTDEHTENLGYLKDYRIHYPNGEVYVEYLQDKMEIQRFNKKTRSRLANYDIIKIQGDVDELNETIFFGIASFYLEIFA